MWSSIIGGGGDECMVGPHQWKRECVFVCVWVSESKFVEARPNFTAYGLTCYWWECFGGKNEEYEVLRKSMCRDRNLI